ncbi:MAG: ribonuclease III [Eubacterium sp.]|nr:ribonuclease III [Eubacterium sp.]
MNDFAKLENRIDYHFNNTFFLKTALTHSTYAYENPRGNESNERMEFLGDSVMSIVTSEYLYKKYPDLPEGRLSKLKSSLICTEALSGFARQIGLGKYLLLGKGEANSNGYDKPTILENAFEALVAAIYLDSDLESARKFVVSFLEKTIENNAISFHDYKSALQEIVQQNPTEILNYVLVGESGPDHNKMFEYEVHLNSNVIGKGKGSSKKQAEQEAARDALVLMGVIKQ